MSTGAFDGDTASPSVHSVVCAGSESGILDCGYSTGACTADHSAAVICQSKMNIQYVIICMLATCVATSC